MSEATMEQMGELNTLTMRQAQRTFRLVRQTLLNRGLYQPRKDGTIREVEWLGWAPWFDERAYVFVLDTARLPVSIEKLTDERVLHQVSTTLGGRRVQITNHRGIAWVVAMDLPPLKEPQARRTLPNQVSLDLSTVPEGAFMLPLGVGFDGPVWRPLGELDCILVGGVRGFGKTTFLFSLLVSLLVRHGPGELQMAIVDPKGFDFVLFDGIPHLWAERATDADAAAALLADLVAEMEDRGEQFARLGVRSLDAFNAVAPEPLPLLLVVVDEVTDLMLEAGRQAAALQRKLIRLVSKGRAAGIVLVVATQNPKSDVFDTLARGNFRTRIAFPVPEPNMSKTILGRTGAEQLADVPGRMLALVEGQSREPVELQGYYLDDEAVKAVTAGLAEREYSPLTGLERDLVIQAVEELDGAFNIDRLAGRFEGRISRNRLKRLARAWERRGWLTPAQVGVSRQVTEVLRALSTTGDAPRG
ncbi:MAG: DNA translocase FtsK [Anaerolineae bacterium]|nr:DNA translocase FtsK [Anaerolineae bacterium]